MTLNLTAITASIAIRPFVHCVVVGTLLLMLTSDAAAFQAVPSNDLQALQTELEKLQSVFGKDHPKVIAMQKKVGLTRRLEDLVQDAPNRKSMINQLQPLLVEEQELNARFGKDHPKLKLVRAKIELVRSHFVKNKKPSGSSTKKTPDSKNRTAARPVDQLVPLIVKEQELVARYGEKHPRVVQLRKQIADIRSTIPQAKPVQRQGAGKGNVSRPVDNTPNVDTDPDTRPRYSMEKHDGEIVLLDRDTGKSWLLKTANGVTKWIPISRGGVTGKGRAGSAAK